MGKPITLNLRFENGKEKQVTHTPKLSDLTTIAEIQDKVSAESGTGGLTRSKNLRYEIDIVVAALGGKVSSEEIAEGIDAADFERVILPKILAETVGTTVEELEAAAKNVLAAVEGR